MKFSNAKMSILSGRKAVLTLTVAVLTGLGYFFMFRSLSPHWDLFWMVVVGVGVSAHAGVWLAERIPRGRRSDGPGLLLLYLAVATMAAAWWFSTPETISLLGSLCRFVAGANTGAFAVEVLTMEPYRKHAHQGGGRADG